MARFRRVLRMVLALSLAMPLVTTLACGGSGSDVKRAKVKVGDMPAGGDWTGVYYSQTYGYLHLIKEGDSISGAWRTDAGDKWGEMHGKATGDVFRFEWTERTIGMVGPTATSRGKGYFKYIAPPDENADHEIHGEWGLGASDAGNSWTAVKQRNQKPDPDSVLPDETQRVEAEGWDEGGGGGSAPPPDEGGGEAPEDDWE